ncbi:hypothetical protein KKA08_01945, partial [bacterium]|nr:hypothetical protein [bacterium]
MNRFYRGNWLFYLTVSCVLMFTSCEQTTEPEFFISDQTREESLPDDAVKMTPADDVFQPVLHSALWDEPGPMAGPINTAGAEDAPVISPDGQTFIFFFTPDIDVLPEDQLLDGITGIWWCQKNGGEWTEPERMVLNNDISLDGPFCL